jgi:hypothetical protein
MAKSGIIRVDPPDAEQAGQIVQAVIKRRPTCVTVPATDGLHRYRFAADVDGGRRQYVFEGDATTKPEHWTESLREVCSQCDAVFDPTKPSMGQPSPGVGPSRLCDECGPVRPLVHHPRR